MHRGQEPTYVRAGLDDERIYMSDCGCVHSWRQTPELAKLDLLFSCNLLTPATYSIIEATYQNPTVEQLVRWQ